jgi:uncharacterized C2H2 Zn-finger protein
MVSVYHKTEAVARGERFTMCGRCGTIFTKYSKKYSKNFTRMTGRMKRYVGL